LELGIQVSKIAWLRPDSTTSCCPGSVYIGLSVANSNGYPSVAIYERA
jgi:hypothetical protein